MIDTLLYQLGVNAYALGIRLASFWSDKARLFIDGRNGLLPKIAAEMAGDTRSKIWMHCASLGEFEQGRPVLEALRITYPQYALVLTFFSPSGFEVRKNYDGADYIYYLPVDSAAHARQFLDIVRPDLSLFVKYELWYFYLSELAKRSIPVLLISALFTERHGFFKWYGSIQRKMLGFCTEILVQDDKSKRLLSGIGIMNVTIAGDTRFDRVVQAVQLATELPRANEFCAGNKVMIAGSTWPADEALLREWLDLPGNDWKLVLVPHNVDAGHINQITLQFAGLLSKWTDNDNCSASRVLLIDTVGQLLKLYRYGTASYIGGGFGKAGVHNVLEPAAWGQPCILGPVYHQFIEVAGLIAAGGAAVVSSVADLQLQTQRMQQQPIHTAMSVAATNFVTAHLGATQQVMHSISTHLPKNKPTR